MIKKELTKALEIALSKLEKIYNVDLSSLKIEVKENKQRKFGDFSTNLALTASKKLSEDPKKVASTLVKAMTENESIKQIDIAGQGFINFFLTQTSRTEILKRINNSKKIFGHKKVNKKFNNKILIEYVSSNPTGPLHVGHGRGAAFGSALSKILHAAGYEVDQEYYVNDQGRQTDILGISVWIRYLQIFNKKVIFPNKCYQGDYVKVLAKQLKEENKKIFLPSEGVKEKFDEFLSKEVKEEKDLDNIIEKSKEELKENFNKIKSFSVSSMLETTKLDLKRFGVNHNLWFKESSMYDSVNSKVSQIDSVIGILQKNNFIYEKEGAFWFKSTDFGDEKDRVIKRKNDQTTYFASDIAYHANKYQRGYKKIINIWGSDHHGYLPRVKAAMDALGEDTNKFSVVFMQFANLIRGGKKVSMSTRGGDFISLHELVEEVGSEAARFFYINRKANQHLDFDLDLAKEESKDNPLYYIQYAHARICSVFEKLHKDKRSYDESLALNSLEFLEGEKEVKIQKLLAQFPDVVSKAADNYEPHLLCYYLRNLAGTFHSYYNSERIIVDNEKELQAKLFMLSAIRQVIFNGLDLLSISSPESM